MSDLLTTLKFVQGSVAKKEIVATLTHFCIENATVRGFNGTLALSSPIAMDINCKPKAAPFIKAIANCKETVKLKITPTGKLSIISGKFRALIECVEEETPHVLPEGQFFDLDGENFVKCLTTLVKFIGNDASRPWSNGIKFEGQIANVTNNAILVQSWMASVFPVICCVHKEAIVELLRIKDEYPNRAQCDGRSLTFHYESGRWIRTALIDPTKWPNVGQVLDTASSPQPIDKEIFVGAETIKPFTDKLGRVYFEQGKLKTHLHDDDEGAVYEVVGLPEQRCFNLDMLMLLKDTVNTIDWGYDKKPAFFFGDNIRGAMVAMRF